MKKIITILLVLVGLGAGVILVYKAKPDSFTTSSKTSSGLVGGNCKYNKYPGTCTVTSVTKNQYGYYTVKFLYQPNWMSKVVFPLKTNLDLSKDQTLESCQPIKETFIAKNSLAVGKEFSCNFEYETAGTCSPFSFSDSLTGCLDQ